MGSELGSVVRANVIGWTVLDEQLGNAVDNAFRVQLALDRDRQALTGELVDHGQHAERPAIVGSVHDEVIRPDMVRPLRPQADAGSVVDPQPASLGLLCRHFQPLPSPDAFDPLVVHTPALAAEQCRDPAITVATIGAGQPYDGRGQSRFMVAINTPIAVRRAWLADDPAYPTLRQRVPRANLTNTAAATPGA